MIFRILASYWLTEMILGLWLRISWVEGYKWFQDTLLDADVAINAMMWQNGGMSGRDVYSSFPHPEVYQVCWGRISSCKEGKEISWLWGRI